MRPVLLRFGPFIIHSYPAMLYLGIVTGLFAQQIAAEERGLNERNVMAASLLLLVPALVGARLLHVLLHWRTFLKEPRRIWRVTEGGAALYGGLILMLPASLPLLAVLKLPLGDFWDTASITMLVALVFTRIGCLLNGCCSGRACESLIALELPDHAAVRKRRIPTQLLEAGWGLLLLGGAVIFWRQAPFRGAIFLCVVAAYGLARFVLEGLREYQDMVGGVSLHRAISAAFVVASAVIFVIAWPR